VGELDDLMGDETELMLYEVSDYFDLTLKSEEEDEDVLIRDLNLGMPISELEKLIRSQT